MLERGADGLLTAVPGRTWGADGRSEAVAAVAVSLIKASTSARRRDEVVAAIRALAAEVSQRLGA